MQGHHWVMLVVVGFVFYIVGTKYPMLAQRIGF
jgi:hypothetical protein